MNKHAIFVAGICLGLSSLSCISMEKKDFNADKLEVFISQKENRITTVFHENHHPQNAGILKVLLQQYSDQNQDVQKVQYSIYYSEKDMNSFVMEFKQLKKQLLEQIQTESKAYNLTCYVIGGSVSKDMMPFLEEEWKDFPMASIEVSTEEKNTNCAFIPSRQVERPKLLFALGAKKYPLQSKEGLKKRWLFSMAQELTRKRFENILNEMQLSYELRGEEGLLPSQFTVSVSSEMENQFTLLTSFSNEMESLSSEGFHPEEFSSLQEYWLKWIEMESNPNTPYDLGKLSSFVMEQNPFDIEMISYPQFLIASLEILKEMTNSELRSIMTDYLSDQYKTIKIFYPDSYDKEGNEKLSFLQQAVDQVFLRSSARTPIAASQPVSDIVFLEQTSMPRSEPVSSAKLMQKLGHAAEDTSIFYQLPLTESEKKIIRKIITTMAEKNVFQLLLEKRSLEKKGKKIRHIHPLRFVGFILADSHLRRCMKTISKSYFKWSNFVEGYEERMKEESKKGQLLPYVPGFAELLKADPQVITNYINKSEYEDLINYFL
jgi:hypothetical protein